ncbi:MAG: hypothetical protein HEQ37_13685 [Acidovorax sp.]|nr:hypothetical protein [Acidovorax sp.]
MRARKPVSPCSVAAALVCLSMAQATQASEPDGWGVGAVLDVAHTSRGLALGQREKGLQLGHSDLSAAGPVGQALEARFTVAAHAHDGKVEAELEEAYLQTRSLPVGLQVRAGRFPSQIGYLNEQHPHADDFVERPLLYRAFLGGHWFDDGVRVNWTAPTPFYLRTGLEIFTGKQLVKEAARAPSPGAFTLSAKLGDDWGRSQSWQLGAAWLHNRREAAQHEEGADGGEAGHDHSHDHAHAHGAAFSGRNMVLLDAAWKWAPDGNNRERQLKVVGEWARVSGINRHARSSDTHEAQSLMAVWRWAAPWEAGVRLDWLKARSPHGDHFHNVRLREQSLMVAYKPTHAQTVRLQLTGQSGAKGVEGAVKRSVQLHYILSFGAHGAHSF